MIAFIISNEMLFSIRYMRKMLYYNGCFNGEKTCINKNKSGQERRKPLFSDYLINEEWSKDMDLRFNILWGKITISKTQITVEVITKQIKQIYYKGKPK